MNLSKFKFRGPSPSKTLHLILYLFSSILFLKEPPVPRLIYASCL